MDGDKKEVDGREEVGYSLGAELELSQATSWAADSLLHTLLELFGTFRALAAVTVSRSHTHTHARTHNTYHADLYLVVEHEEQQLAARGS